MKKILMVTGSLRVGGLETVAMNIARNANPQKYSFDFVVYGDDIGEYEEEVCKMGGTVFHLPRPSRGYYKQYKNLCRLIKENGPYAAIHAHTFFNSGIALRAGYSCGVKVRIAHSHSVKRNNSNRIDKTIFNFIMRRWLLKYSTKVCACSANAGNYLFTEKVYAEKGMFVPNVINVKFYEFSQDDRIIVRKKYNVEDDCILIGQVGHLTSSKNQFFLLDLFKFYSNIRNAKLILVGDGELKQKLQLYAEKIDIKDKIIFTGTRSDINRMLSAMDVFVCTSTNEGFGIVLIESQANSLPCVIEENTLIDEIKKLGNCITVKGFNDFSVWTKAIDKAFAQGRNQALSDILKNSIYSDTNYSIMIDQIYEEIK